MADSLERFHDEDEQQELTPPPVICTLDPKQRTTQKLEWSDISGIARQSERLPNGIRATFASGVEAQLRELADRELDCCGSWLSISVQSGAATTTGAESNADTDSLTLEVTTENPDGLELIYSMVK